MWYENDVAFVSFLWSITVKPGPKGDRSQWTTLAVEGFYSFLVFLSMHVCLCVISYSFVPYIWIDSMDDSLLN